MELRNSWMYSMKRHAAMLGAATLLIVSRAGTLLSKFPSAHDAAGSGGVVADTVRGAGAQWRKLAVVWYSGDGWQAPNQESAMPQIEVNEEQIVRALDQLSPTARRTALAKLIRGYDALDRLIERNRDRIEAVCRERGVEFARLTEEEREQLIDDLLHQAS